MCHAAVRIATRRNRPALEKALASVAPIADFNLNVEAQKVTFRFAGDPQVGPAFTQAIRKLGYGAESAIIDSLQ